MAAAYAFKAEPRAVSNRPKYREDDLTNTKPSLQFDPRVYRGVTCVPRDQAGSSFGAVGSYGKRRKPKPVEPSPFSLPLPEPERQPVDLTGHLVAAEVVVECTTVDSQTDQFLPEEPEPEFVPPKTGLDVATQVLQGELFHFDTEVQPILSVLVTKTLEQALTEVEEEVEMQNVSTFKGEWQKRQAQLMDDWAATVQQECVRAAEKQKLLAAAKARKQKEQRLFAKLHCARLAAEYLDHVLPGATRRCIEMGQFPEELQNPVEVQLCAWLATSAVEEIERRTEVQEAVRGLVGHIVREERDARQAGWKAYGEKMKAQAAIEAVKQDALKGKIRIHLDRGDGTMIEIGPIKVRSDEPMEEIHGRTLDWLKEHHPDVAASAPHGVVLYIGDAPAPASSELFTATPGSIFLKRAEPPVEEPAETPQPEG